MIEDLITDFSPETFGEWCREKFDRFTADPHVVPNDEGFSQARVVGYVNVLPDGEANRPLLVMSVYAGQKINERTSRRKQFDFARKQLQAALDRPPAKVKGLFTQGLFAFHDSEGNFRLSLVSGRADGKRLVYSEFKRQSFFVHPGRNNKTFRARMEPAFGSYGDIGKAFSVEALTREFYNSLFAWYERAISPESKVTFPNDIKRHDDDRSLLAEHLIRLITRLMFVWFIRQKDLIPDTIFDADELKKILKAFDPVSQKEDDYYRAILQNLFFATLNCEIKDRTFATDGDDEEGRKEHYGIKLLYRYSEEFAYTKDEVKDLFRRVPFLNGGLFECLDHKKGSTARSPVIYQDGFSRNPECMAHIPNNLFFDDRGLITLFSHYDFTVDENDPNDSDVALDPELLGKVFENLLGAYNPETKETARNQSGSFYTPREIVKYMVDESLVAHLRTQVPAVEESVFRQYLGDEEPSDIPNHLRHDLVNALYHCRILDPACGSGAFPMGLLLKMVHLLQRLDPKNALWHEVVMAEAEKDLTKTESLGKEEKEQRRRRITESFDLSVNHPDYARKLYLIENCIFGVDIQPIAVQIAKLRAFITLICDQTPDLTDAERNYRMLPLPNLETKFVATNTLIGLPADFSEGLKTADGASRLEDPELERLRRELDETRHRHFRARSAPEKNACRKRDDELRKQIKNRLVEIACKPDAQKIALYKTEIEKLREKRKRVEREAWQEVIQSQPQQTNLFDNTPSPVQTVIRVDLNKEPRDKIDDNIRRHTRAIEAEESRSKNKSKFEEAADLLAAWNPYNQNAPSPFFDPEWMFGFRGGFDIVIGNPPFVRLQKLKEKDKIAYASAGYKTFSKSSDLYCLFYERGGTLLNDKGTLCYISSNKFFRSSYGKPLRQLLQEQYSLLRLIDFGELPVFEAGTDPVITQFGKQRRPDFLAASIKNPDDIKNVFRAVTLLGHAMAHAELSTDGWSLSGREAAGILEKMRHNSTPLGKYVNGEIYYGIKTGFDAAFIIDDKTRNELVKRNPRCTGIIKPLYKGDDVRKWRCSTRRWWHIVTKIGINMSAYPEIMEHLGKWQLELERRSDKGEQWWELRPCAYYEKIEVVKIVFPDIAKESRFALDDSGAYVSTTSFFIPKSDTYLLGVLNSRCVWYWAKHTLALLGDAQKGGRLRFKRQYMMQVPLPTANERIKSNIVNLVERILTTTRAGQVGMPSQPSCDVSAFEAEIDRLVYELYGLTDDEIAIVEGRQPGVKTELATMNPFKAASGRKSRKSVMMDDPDLA